MTFASIEYIIFLPVVFLLYWIVCGKNKNLQNGLIVLASLFFYGFWDWRFLGFYDLYRPTFENSELGRIKKLLPLSEMTENFGLVSKSMKPKLGRKSYYFTAEGKVALMFLKIVRNTERALRPEESQGSDEADRNPEHLLRHPHGERDAIGGQDRAESTAGGCLTRKYAHRKVLQRGNYASVIRDRRKIRSKWPE